MYKEVIRSLLLQYNLLARGRGVLRKDQVEMMHGFAKQISGITDDVLVSEGEAMSKADRADRAEAGMIVHHIDEMVELLIRKDVI